MSCSQSYNLIDGVSVSASTKTESLTGLGSGFSVQAVWASGSSFDADFSIEVSNDNVNFNELPSTVRNETDASGSLVIDVLTFTKYFRFSVVVNSGSATLTVDAFQGQD